MKRPSGAVIDLSQKKHPNWETVLPALAKRPGVTMFLGASDTGKTTRLRCAATYLARAGLLPLAIVDADIGQSTIGPPTTVGLTLVTKENLPDLLSDRLACNAMRFIGALSPVGHLLQTIVATKMLVDKALRRGARAVLVDTTGLVGQNVGFQLKLNKIELLEPRHIVVLQRERELEAVLSVVAHRPRLAVHRLAVSSQVRTRSAAERYRYRSDRFAVYFRSATRVQLETRKLFILSPSAGPSKLAEESLSPVISLGSFSSQNIVGCLVGLNNASDETLALGLLVRVTHHGQKMDVLTPVRNFSRVRVVRLTNIRLAQSGEEFGRLDSRGSIASSSDAEIASRLCD
jgi:polynucleotide 5'-kinase involved in rRNA processing